MGLSRYANCRKAACRGAGRGPAKAWMPGPASGPESRTTATPARPGALARAKMLGLMKSSVPRLSAVLFDHGSGAVPHQFLKLLERLGSALHPVPKRHPGPHHAVRV